MNNQDIDTLCVNTIRTLAMDIVEKSNSGHPGTPMEAAVLAHTLFMKHLRFDPSSPQWPGRDRFVLSAGHASALLYTMNHLTGQGLTLDDLKSFRQWGSLTPGHPERHPELGIETTTGPLGQGLANGVGMGIAQRYLAHMFSRPGFEELFDFRVWAFCSDGDMQEGISHEAAALAGHLKLGSLIYVYLDNKITIEGSTDISMSEDVGARFQAYGWHVLRVEGNDAGTIQAAMSEGEKTTDRPTLIIARTHIASGSPNMQDTAEAHGAPLGAAEVAATKKNLGWPEDSSFLVPDEVRDHYTEAVKKGRAARTDWEQRWKEYANAHPAAAAECERIRSHRLPDGWDKDLPTYEPSSSGVATRNASGDAINALAARLPELIGGSADLAPSNNTHIKGGGDFSPTEVGRNLHFGIREHAMGSILNGMTVTGGLIPFGATFLIFSDYMRPTLRLDSLAGERTILVYTHDSIGLGEDGPTHQPIEHLASLRAIPGVAVIRPSDANETIEAWKVAVSRHSGPVCIVLTRQKLPTLARDTAENAAASLQRGAYILHDPADGSPEVILISTGSEVAPTLQAALALEAQGIKVRVVAMPCWELFSEQDSAYRQSVLPSSVTKRVSVEAAATFGWERWIGLDGLAIGIDRFGASAPGDTLMTQFGFSADAIKNRVRTYLAV